MSHKATSGARADYWRQHIEAWQSSGQSQQGYCKAKDLNYGRFVYWRRKFREATTRRQRRTSSDFVPVTCQPPAPTIGLCVVLPSGLELRGISADNVGLVRQLLSSLV
jgi:hypothetical protein